MKEVAIFISSIKALNVDGNSFVKLEINGKSSNFEYETKPYDGVKDPIWKMNPNHDKDAIFYVNDNSSILKKTECKVTILKFNRYRDSDVIGSNTITLEKLADVNTSKKKFSIVVGEATIEINMKRSTNTYNKENDGKNDESDQIVEDITDYKTTYVLNIKNIKCKDLVDTTSNKLDSQDPAVRITIGDRTYTTKHIKNGGSNVSFNEEYDFNILERDLISKDLEVCVVHASKGLVGSIFKSIGTGSISLSDSIPKWQYDKTQSIQIPLTYEDDTRRIEQGLVLLSLKIITSSSKNKDDIDADEVIEDHSSGLPNSSGSVMLTDSMEKYMAGGSSSANANAIHSQSSQSLQGQFIGMGSGSALSMSIDANDAKDIPITIGLKQLVINLNLNNLDKKALKKAYVLITHGDRTIYQHDIPTSASSKFSPSKSTDSLGSVSVGNKLTFTIVPKGEVLYETRTKALHTRTLDIKICRRKMSIRKENRKVIVGETSINVSSLIGTYGANMEFDGEVTDEDGTEFIGSVNIDLYEMNDEDGTFHESGDQSTSNDNVNDHDSQFVQNSSQSVSAAGTIDQDMRELTRWQLVGIRCTNLNLKGIDDNCTLTCKVVGTSSQWSYKTDSKKVSESASWSFESGTTGTFFDMERGDMQIEQLSLIVSTNNEWEEINMIGRGIVKRTEMANVARLKKGHIVKVHMQLVDKDNSSDESGTATVTLQCVGPTDGLPSMPNPISDSNNTNSHSNMTSIQRPSSASIKRETSDDNKDDLQVHLLGVRCWDLKNVEMMGKNDPYCKINIGDWLFQTETQWEAGNFAEWVYGTTSSHPTTTFRIDKNKLFKSKLTVNVYDANRFRHDVLIGELSEVRMKSFIQELLTSPPGTRITLKDCIYSDPLNGTTVVGYMSLQMSIGIRSPLVSQFTYMLGESVLVDARMQSGRNELKGKVVSLNYDGTYDVQYENSDQIGREFHENDIRRVGSPVPAKRVNISPLRVTNASEAGMEYEDNEYIQDQAQDHSPREKIPMTEYLRRNVGNDRHLLELPRLSVDNPNRNSITESLLRRSQQIPESEDLIDSDPDSLRVYLLQIKAANIKYAGNRMSPAPQRDPYIVLEIGDLWNYKTPIRMDGGPSPSWPSTQTFFMPSDVGTVLDVSRSNLRTQNLKVKVYDAKVKARGIKSKGHLMLGEGIIDLASIVNADDSEAGRTGELVKHVFSLQTPKARNPCGHVTVYMRLEGTTARANLKMSYRMGMNSSVSHSSLMNTARNGNNTTARVNSNSSMNISRSQGALTFTNDNGNTATLGRSAGRGGTPYGGGTRGSGRTISPDRRRADKDAMDVALMRQEMENLILSNRRLQDALDSAHMVNAAARNREDELLVEMDDCHNELATIKEGHELSIADYERNLNEYQVLELVWTDEKKALLKRLEAAKVELTALKERVLELESGAKGDDDEGPRDEMMHEISSLLRANAVLQEALESKTDMISANEKAYQEAQNRMEDQIKNLQQNITRLEAELEAIRTSTKEQHDEDQLQIKSLKEIIDNNIRDKEAYADELCNDLERKLREEMANKDDAHAVNVDQLKDKIKTLEETNKLTKIRAEKAEADAYKLGLDMAMEKRKAELSVEEALANHNAAKRDIVRKYDQMLRELREEQLKELEEMHEKWRKAQERITELECQVAASGGVNWGSAVVPAPSVGAVTTLPVKKLLSTVRLISASCSGLPNVEIGMDENDPYMKIQVAHWSFDTDVQHGSGSGASWEIPKSINKAVFEIPTNELNKSGIIQVWDHNRFRSHTLIGTSTVESLDKYVLEAGEQEVELVTELERVGVSEADLENDNYDEESEEFEHYDPYDVTIKLVKIQCMDLKDVEMIGKNDPYCILELEGVEETNWSFQTEPSTNTGDKAAWSYTDEEINKESTRLSFDANRDSLSDADLTIVVKDKNTLRSDQLIGQSKVNLKEIAMARVNQFVTLNTELITKKGVVEGKCALTFTCVNYISKKNVKAKSNSVTGKKVGEAKLKFLITTVDANWLDPNSDEYNKRQDKNLASGPSAQFLEHQRHLRDKIAELERNLAESSKEKEDVRNQLSEEYRHVRGALKERDEALAKVLGAEKATQHARQDMNNARKEQERLAKQREKMETEQEKMRDRLEKAKDQSMHFQTENTKNLAEATQLKKDLIRAQEQLEKLKYPAENGDKRLKDELLDNEWQLERAKLLSHIKALKAQITNLGYTPTDNEGKDVVVEVNLLGIECKYLQDVEFIGKNDPFCSLAIGNTWTMTTTHLKDTGATASWHYRENDEGNPKECKFNMSRQDLNREQMRIDVYDHNDLRSHQTIGSGFVDLNKLAGAALGVETTLQMDLQSRKGEAAGEVILTFVNRKAKIVNEETTKVVPGKLIMERVVCNDLKNVEIFGGENDPYAVLQLLHGREEQWSLTTPPYAEGGSNVRWELGEDIDGCTFEHDSLVDILSNSGLKVHVSDKNDYRSDTSIGAGIVSLKALTDTRNVNGVTEMKFTIPLGKEMNPTLHSRKNAKKLRQKVINDANPRDLKHYKLLRIECNDLKDVEMMGKNDPFCKLSLTSGDAVEESEPFWEFTTGTSKDTGDRAKFSYMNHSKLDPEVIKQISFDALQKDLQKGNFNIEVYDHNSIRSHQFIGGSTISSSQLASADVQQGVDQVVIRVPLMNDDHKTGHATIVFMAEKYEKKEGEDEEDIVEEEIDEEVVDDEKLGTVEVYISYIPSRIEKIVDEGGVPTTITDTTNTDQLEISLDEQLKALLLKVAVLEEEKKDLFKKKLDSEGARVGLETKCKELIAKVRKLRSEGKVRRVPGQFVFSLDWLGTGHPGDLREQFGSIAQQLDNSRQELGLNHNWAHAIPESTFTTVIDTLLAEEEKLEKEIKEKGKTRTPEQFAKDKAKNEVPYRMYVECTWDAGVQEPVASALKEAAEEAAAVARDRRPKIEAESSLRIHSTPKKLKSHYISWLDTNGSSLDWRNQGFFFGGGPERGLL